MRSVAAQGSLRVLPATGKAMGGEHLPEHLADTRHVTVVLRLVATAAGRLVHGELVDPDGASLAKFLDWEDLIEALQRHLDD